MFTSLPGRFCRNVFVFSCLSLLMFVTIVSSSGLNERRQTDAHTGWMQFQQRCLLFVTGKTYGTASKEKGFHLSVKWSKLWNKTKVYIEVKKIGKCIYLKGHLFNLPTILQKILHDQKLTSQKRAA